MAGEASRSGRDVEELEPPLVQRGEDLFGFLVGVAGGQGPSLDPACRRARTWSRISAMRGERTMVTPSRQSAGSWKHSDLPPPVGMMAKRVAPGQDGADDFLLSRAEALKAEDAGQQGGGVGHQRKAAALFCSTIRSAMTPISTTSGARSTPPSAGRNRRTRE